MLEKDILKWQKKAEEVARDSLSEMIEITRTVHSHQPN